MLAEANDVEMALASGGRPAEKSDLRWYRHDGRTDGTFRWSANAGTKVGNGWDVRHIFADVTR